LVGGDFTAIMRVGPAMSTRGCSAPRARWAAPRSEQAYIGRTRPNLRGRSQNL
jgi:hypothetical protein